jgi:hypothetical protein
MHVLFTRSGGRKFGDIEKPLAAPRNPLKSLKTANEMFGKAWRFQAIDLEMLGVDLEILAGAGGRRAGGGELAVGLIVSRARIRRVRRR